MEGFELSQCAHTVMSNRMHHLKLAVQLLSKPDLQPLTCTKAISGTRQYKLQGSVGADAKLHRS